MRLFSLVWLPGAAAPGGLCALVRMWLCRWDFSLEESPDGASLVLEVAVGRFLDTSLIQTDLQPTFVRLLIKGKMLQLLLPCEVRPDASKAQRNTTTGERAWRCELEGVAGGGPAGGLGRLGGWAGDDYNR